MKKKVIKTVKEKKRLGAASIKIDLSGGMITIYHGQNGAVLEKFEASEHSWKAIWKGIKKAK